MPDCTNPTPPKLQRKVGYRMDCKERFAKININSAYAPLNNKSLTQAHLPKEALEILQELNKNNIVSTTETKPRFDSVLAEIKKQQAKRDKYEKELTDENEKDILDGVLSDEAQTEKKAYIKQVLAANENHELWAELERNVADEFVGQDRTFAIVKNLLQSGEESDLDENETKLIKFLITELPNKFPGKVGDTLRVSRMKLTGIADTKTLNELTKVVLEGSSSSSQPRYKTGDHPEYVLVPTRFKYNDDVFKNLINTAPPFDNVQIMARLFHKESITNLIDLMSKKETEDEVINQHERNKIVNYNLAYLLKIFSPAPSYLSKGKPRIIIVDGKSFTITSFEWEKFVDEEKAIEIQLTIEGHPTGESEEITKARKCENISEELSFYGDLLRHPQSLKEYTGKDGVIINLNRGLSAHRMKTRREKMFAKKEAKILLDAGVKKPKKPNIVKKPKKPNIVKRGGGTKKLARKRKKTKKKKRRITRRRTRR